MAVDRWRLFHHPGITVRAAAIKVLALHSVFVHSLEPEKFHFGPLLGVWAIASFTLQ